MANRTFRKLLNMVPSISQVRPGAAVSIVLKQDQPTGRQVQGTVKDVLTSGNHPRGIKVRLSDGRIGRVQRMVTGDVAAASQEAIQADLQNQQVARGVVQGRSSAPYRSHMLNSRYTDVRQDEDVEEPPAELDLMSFVKQAKPKKRGKGTKAGQSSSSATSEAVAATVSCPVCAEFEGDEAAVAHHVETHFTN